jgi:hypothetical protein
VQQIRAPSARSEKVGTRFAYTLTANPAFLFTLKYPRDEAALQAYAPRQEAFDGADGAIPHDQQVMPRLADRRHFAVRWMLMADKSADATPAIHERKLHRLCEFAGFCN